MTMSLALLDLSFSHPGADKPTVAGLDLMVKPGTLTALLGPSGSGKTTILRLIAGLLAPDRGDIRLGNRSLLGLPPERRNAVLVFQAPLLFPQMTVAQNVGFGLRMQGLPKPVIAARTGAMLERLHLTGLGNRTPEALSGGQAQRVALARALILEPDLFMLDEPLSSLDPGLREDMQALIRELQRDLGVTTLVVTHDQAEAVALADSIAVLHDGRIVQDAAPETIFSRPATAAVARFFGGENFLPGHARDGLFHCEIGPLPLPLGAGDGPGTLTVRPEALVLGPGAEAREAQVVANRFLGLHCRVELVVAGCRLVALVAPDLARGLVEGQKIGVTLPRQALWVLPTDPAPQTLHRTVP